MLDAEIQNCADREILSAGKVVGLIDSILSGHELINEMGKEAGETICERLRSLVSTYGSTMQSALRF